MIDSTKIYKMYIFTTDSDCHSYSVILSPVDTIKVFFVTESLGNVFDTLFDSVNRQRKLGQNVVV